MDEEEKIKLDFERAVLWIKENCPSDVSFPLERGISLLIDLLNNAQSIDRLEPNAHVDFNSSFSKLIKDAKSRINYGKVIFDI